MTQEQKFEKFKKHCIDQKLGETMFLSKHHELTNLQESKYSNRCYRPVYKIFRGDFCPCCGAKLLKTEIGELKYLLSCHCGYEYADCYPYP